jgi:hypothetical protein
MILSIYAMNMKEHGDNDVRETEIHTAEPLVPELSAFEFEMTIENLKDTNRQVLIEF